MTKCNILLNEYNESAMKVYFGIMFVWFAKGWDCCMNVNQSICFL